MKLQAGSTLQSGKYFLDRALGTEGMGATFLATQTLLQQPVVIKTLDPSLQVTQSFAQLNTLFIEETRLLARHQHPSIVRVLDFFQEENLPFLVMEYIPGKTLRERVIREGHLSEVEAVHYVRQIASALSVAHRGGLIHRNLSPDAIVQREGTNLGILVGFGLAHELAIPNTLQPNPFKPANSQSENRFAIDLYSLAATLYYLLAGEPPSENLSLDRAPWMTPIKQAILRGMSQDPEWQLQTVDDWLKLLPNTSLPLLATTPTGSASTQNGAKLPTLNGSTVMPSSNSSPSSNGSPSSNSATIGATNSATNGATAAKPTPILAVTADPKAPTMKPATPFSQSVGMSRHLPKFLGLTIAATAAMGLGFGFALRISAAKAPGTSILHPAQTFGEKDWKGTLNPSGNLSDIPVENQLGDFQERPAETPPAPRAADPALDTLPIKPIPSPELELPDVRRSIAPAPTRRRIKPAPVETEPPVEPSYIPDPDPLPQKSPANPLPPASSTTPELPPVTPAPQTNSTREAAPTPALEPSPRE